MNYSRVITELNVRHLRGEAHLWRITKCTLSRSYVRKETNVVYLFIYSFIRLFIHLFIYLFIYTREIISLKSTY